MKEQHKFPSKLYVIIFQKYFSILKIYNFQPPSLPNGNNNSKQNLVINNFIFIQFLANIRTPFEVHNQYEIYL